jgi:ATP-dependent helicase STH1/SNF2
MSTIRRRITGNQYKSVLDFREDWLLMFNNARTYNQEGSWVYQDADEMQKVFDAAFNKSIVGSGLPGAPPAPNPYDSALSPMDDGEQRPISKGKNARRAVISDEEYLTPSDEE